MASPSTRQSAHTDQNGCQEQLSDHVKAQLSRLADQALSTGLYLVATPIGHLGDITLRALSVLARVDVIYAEDTRTSRILLESYGIKTTLKSYHEHSSESKRDEILKALDDGKRIALISDAGTPLVSDPGYKLVRALIEANQNIHALPGPSATLSALSVAGLPTDSFMFAGFLTNKSGERRTRIAALKDVPATLIFFESPSRIIATLTDLADQLGSRPAVVARELTKRHEEVIRGPLDTLSQQAKNMTLKGECVIVVGPPTAQEVSDNTIIALLREQLAQESLRDAAKAVAHDLGISRSRVYNLALALKRSDQNAS